MPLYRIRVIREEGPEPISGEHIEHAEEVVRVEGDSPWKAAQMAPLKMEMNPHGRLLRYYDADTGEEITAAQRERVFRPGTFTIESIQGPYSGYTDGDGWNGWATPYFEFDVAKRIAVDYMRISERIRLRGIEPGDYRAEYNEAEGAFLFYEPINDDEVFYYAQTITVEGREVKVYAIGTYEWTWEEVPIEKESL